MFLTKTKYTLRDSFRQITRHKLFSFLTILTIAITLALLSVAGLVAVNSYNATQSLEDQLRVIAFLKQPSDPEKNTALMEKLQDTDHVENVEYVSKDDALNSLDAQMSNSELNVKETVGDDNPLPDSFRITVDQPENIEGIVAMLENEEIIESINYGQDLVDNVVSFNRTAAAIGALVIVLMIIATLFLINTTIQLTVNSRRDEIQIMKLVGAKNSFIRMPFFIEGIILGALGAVVAALLVWWGYESIYSYIVDNLPFLPLLNNSYMMVILVAANLFVGIVLGALGSVLAVHKHLKI